MKRFEHKFTNACIKNRDDVYECVYCGRKTNERNYMIGTTDECSGLLRKELEKLNEINFLSGILDEQLKKL